jgi:hypothetical protein
LESALKITRPRNSKATAAVHAEWIHYEKNQMLTAPLDGLETASKLLRAFLENRKLDDLAKWSKAEE